MSGGEQGERLAALNAGDSWEFSYEKHPKCPHCGKVCDLDDYEWYNLYEEGEHEVECPGCDRDFTVSTNVTFSFSTDEQPDDES